MVLNTLAFASTMLAMGCAAKSLHIVHRSPDVAAPMLNATSANSSASAQPQTSGFRTTAYFTNWGIYARNFTPMEVPATKLTHVLYAFADLRADNGSIFLIDPWADVEKKWPGDKEEQGNNMYGNLKQLNLLKRKNRNMKLLLSIGGYTLSKNFSAAFSTAPLRQAFARSAVTILKDHGFDGMDVDWEYPANATEAQNLVEALRVLRSELNTYSLSLPNRPHFLVTIAAPAGPRNYRLLDLPAMERYLDFINLMTYDYAGSWDTISGHNSNWEFDAGNPAATPFAGSRVVKDYMAAGVPASKLCMGAPLYARGFYNNTFGPGYPYEGLPNGTWGEAGVYDYKSLPTAGFKTSFDSKLGAAWSYNEATREMISHETPESMRNKANIIKQMKLGGSMVWELSTDRTGDASLVNALVEPLHAQGLEISQNVIDYPFSKYDNVKNGFPGQ